MKLTKIYLKKLIKEQMDSGNYEQLLINDNFKEISEEFLLHASNVLINLWKDATEEFMWDFENEDAVNNEEIFEDRFENYLKKNKIWIYDILHSKGMTKRDCPGGTCPTS